MHIATRYASAVRASNLRSAPDTDCSAVDVVGAYGIAGKRHALGAALARLLAGDRTAERDVIAQMAVSLTGRAYRNGAPIPYPDALQVAAQVLAWWRDPACPDCHGLGYALAPGAPALSDHECTTCHGAGKRKLTAGAHTELAQWLADDIAREVAIAGAAAMRALAPTLHI